MPQNTVKGKRRRVPHCVGDGMRVSAKKWSAGAVEDYSVQLFCAVPCSAVLCVTHILVFTIRFILTFAFDDGSRPK